MGSPQDHPTIQECDRILQREGILASSKIFDKATLTEVIIHEAVHAIQDCLGGDLASSSERSIKVAWCSITSFVC